MKRKNMGLVSLVAAIVLILAVVAGFVYSKYVQKDEFGGTANISADLGNIQIFESEAKKQDDGSYILDVSKPVTENTYSVVLPGLDIPKDPYVKITDKSSIEAYVYVEVVDTNIEDAEISYELTENWKDLGIMGPESGKVYCYAIDGNPFAINSNVEKIKILKNDKIIVSDKLDKEATELKLEFYAYMAETAAGADAKAAYQNTFSTP